MRTVTLAGTGLVTSALGFGCNGLLGERTPADALTLLDVAFDAGIRYFDVARVYGYGEAERLVGKFAKSKRSEILIASKFGIEPFIAVASSSLIRDGVRNLMRLSPRLRQFLGRQARGAVKTRRFTADLARRSLEISLRTLATDYIDVYLLHDCLLEHASDELLEFLIRARDEGKIRCFGAGTSPEQILAICTQRPQFATVVQFQNSLLCSNACAIKSAPAAVITHGALAGSYNALARHLSNHPEVARTWSDTLREDCSQPGRLAALMLNYALSQNRRGPLLFRSRRVKSIQANARSVVEERFTVEQLDDLARLAQESRVQSV